MAVKIIAAAWGFAEATLFFIVPDVWTSATGINNLKQGLIACLWALTGALAGGLLMYLWGQYEPVVSTHWVESVPAINTAMMDEVRASLTTTGIGAMFIGPLQGIPYKTFAVQAYGAGIPLGLFLLLSIPARLIRFALVTVLANVVARYALPNRSVAFRRSILLAVWALFYGYYFTVMSS
ncbi:MAG: hypothetical protein LJE74_10235 [Proteobacteria bacterium]|nr:hypothetical protein [Pseudomonadota bacterium]MCG6936537.1 hypothetical protein [Pseudomonadota bacterium]